MDNLILIFIGLAALVFCGKDPFAEALRTTKTFFKMLRWRKKLSGEEGSLTVNLLLIIGGISLAVAILRLIYVMWQLEEKHGLYDPRVTVPLVVGIIAAVVMISCGFEMAEKEGGRNRKIT